MANQHDLLTPKSELFDRLHDSVICTDLNGIVTYCNQAAERLYEYKSSELVGSSVALLYPESELPKMQPLLQEVLVKGKADCKLINVSKSGREFLVHLVVSRLTHADGTPIGMVGFSIDTTEVERAERRLRDVEEINRAARRASGVGTWHWDLRNDTLWWDSVSCALLDTSPDDEQSQAIFLNCIHSSDRRRVRELLEECLRTGQPYACEYRIKHRDGAVHWLSASGRVEADQNGKALRMLGTATNISARKFAEEQLRETEAKYRVLYDSPMIGVALGDLDTFTDVNDTFCRIVGRSREELLSGIRWQDITPTEHLVNDYSALQQMVSTGSCTPFEKEYVRKDGEKVRVMLGAALVSRDPLSWSCFILDVTEHHRALEALRKAEQVTAAAQMGSLLAHEINNPLAALSNAIYLLRHGTESLSRDDLLTAAEESWLRVSRITRQMIGIYGSADRVSDIKVADVLDDTLTGYLAQISRKQLRVEKRNELGATIFRGVESDMRKLVSVLVENAVEHTPMKGKLKLHVYRGRDWTEPARDGIRIVVADNGPGILSENLPRLFQPFFSTGMEAGKGLGLWAGAGIVDKAKGRIKVRSVTASARSGTCVSVFLPERRGAASPVAASTL